MKHERHILKENFADWNEVAFQFGLDKNDLTPVLVFGYYDVDGYEGSAKVVYKMKDTPWGLLEGSHCSCYGLSEGYQSDFFLPDTHFKALEQGKRLIDMGPYNQEFDAWLKWATGLKAGKH